MSEKSIPDYDSGRRRFLGGLAAGLLVTPVFRLSGETQPASAFRAEAESLLRDWCDGLLRFQIIDPGNPKLHGSFKCPSCARIHGRCGDAFLPLLAAAALTGQMRYRDAAMNVLGWMKNVDSEDGAWTNEADPASWKGTTIFSAIALAEALEWHGDLIPAETRAEMLPRLKRAGEFVLANFTADFGNINYACAGAYGLTLLGDLLDEPTFTKRGRELAHEVLAMFTPKDHLLFGEGRPNERRSAKGCYPVDLGYNVAESLPALIHYATLKNDGEVMAAAVLSLKKQLEFMLPDGAWDNSWGTRNYKWSYWGSRTADGCLSAFNLLAENDPVFATAAWKNLNLLRACTHGGLLHGGPHFTEHGVPPCVHHTFVQAKAIAGALQHAFPKQALESLPPLPRVVAEGIRHFPELDVCLSAFGPWRATISGYDWHYRPNLYQATGGTLGILWHERLGPMLTGGLAKYLPIERHNMQPVPDDEDVANGCRVEITGDNGAWFTNLYDGGARIRHESSGRGQRFLVDVSLLSSTAENPDSGPCRFRIEYLFEMDSFTMVATPLDPVSFEWSLVLPLVSRQSEGLVERGAGHWEVAKPEGLLRVSSNSPIARQSTCRERAFNLIPGFQTIPFRVSSTGNEPIEIRIFCA